MTEEKQQEIFDQWVQDYQALLFKVVRAFADQSFLQDDLFQDIAIQVWNSIPKFQAKSAVSTWLYRIALNTAITWTKKEKKHQSGRSEIADVESLLVTKEPLDERLAWLYEEIAKLNAIDRSISLLFLDGYSYKEMAEILGISVNHVGVKINRIKKELIIKSENYDYHGV